MSSNNVKIIPALMPKTFSELSEYAGIFGELVDTVQLDIMDGVFVPVTSWPYVDSGDMDEHLKKIVAKEETLPALGGLKFEFDLMIKTPEKIIKSLVQTGASRLVFHIESIEDFDWFWKNLAFITSPSPEFGISGIEIGLALNTTTSNEEIYLHMEKIDFVQFMGIEKIGFQGQAFDDRVLGKMGDMRAKFPDMVISVDGSVNMETAPKLIEAGATRLVIGSKILKSNDIKKTIKEFQNL